MQGTDHVAGSNSVGAKEKVPVVHPCHQLVRHMYLRRKPSRELVAQLMDRRDGFGRGHIGLMSNASEQKDMGAR